MVFFEDERITKEDIVVSIAFWGIIAIAIISFITVPVSANITFFGIPNYSEVVLPNNSYVHQGENISQGFFYDLTGIYGFSGKVGHWKNSDDAGFTYPDNVMDLGGTPYSVYIDPAKFVTGKWYQFDGGFCNKEDTFCTYSFGSGNAYVFYVVRNITPPKPVVTKRILNSTASPRITIISFDPSGSKSVVADVNTEDTSNESYVIVETPIDAVPVHTIILPTPTVVKATETTPVPEQVPSDSSIPIVTPKAPLGFCIILSLLVIACLRH